VLTESALCRYKNKEPVKVLMSCICTQAREAAERTRLHACGRKYSNDRMHYAVAVDHIIVLTLRQHLGYLVSIELLLTQLYSNSLYSVLRRLLLILTLNNHITYY
jgi:hypothetical protein